MVVVVPLAAAGRAAFVPGIGKLLAQIALASHGEGEHYGMGGIQSKFFFCMYTLYAYIFDVYIYIYTRACACVCVRMRACVYVCVCVCVCVYVCILR